MPTTLPIDPNAIYKPSEVAIILRTGRAQVYEWIRSGVLPSFRLGYSTVGYRILGSDVGLLVEKLKGGTQ